jgi:hypothetical protein
MIFGGFWIIFWLASFGFWCWMLIDCLTRRYENFASGGQNAKLIWALVIILANLVGALIYLFVIKLRESGSPSATA